MNAKELLLTRQSTPRLVAPAPNEAQLQFILDAAVRVPDHAGLSPYEFIIAQEDGLKRLAEIYKKAAIVKGADEAMIEKAAKLPFRAPMVITVVANYSQHPKVPEVEQTITAGCSVMAMQQAAFSQGLGGIWRTGSYAFDDTVKAELGIDKSSQIVGFLYLGTPAVQAPIKPNKSGADFARYI
ncbi:NAD(P)H nitroreductase [Parashewanella curva]|uniref:Putative NAD(P)H nitroreductase n=1 Tax=Parashewanella curva TaxID=2338552 RepID=A0A3L8PSY5_9GAMM|nr:NAD(P)H nitroreductase [Parashewanella curva]RLV58456.1 NAD(P)H nitroreductase [Parashewanella curva]